jgi:enamine deaminase RidA (YjgF/YER057c/UK114 family)
MESRGAYLANPDHRGIEVSCLERRGVKEVFATALPTASDDFPTLLRRLRQSLRELEAEILEMRIFSTTDAYARYNEALLGQFGDVDWPVTYIYGDTCPSGKIAGIQVHAASGVSVAPVRLGGSTIGRLFEDDHARYCVLGNLHSNERSRSREAQARDMFQKMEKGLTAAGMDLRSVVRTWFFIRDILDWYSDFNAVRTETYAARGMFDRYVPASTAIGGGNPGDVAVVANALAMQPKGDDVVVREIPSPLQCPARDYGSSFSRAAEVSSPGFRSILVSGTASIDPNGSTVHVGDVRAQIGRTLEVVEAILQSRGMDFADVIRANAYFRHPGDFELLSSHGGRYRLPTSRVVVSHADICRDDLLFEIELDAAMSERSGRHGSMSRRAEDAAPVGSVR